MLIDSGFRTREVPTARMRVNVAGRERAVTVELRSDVKNREEDGLVPTSFFHSVFGSTARRAVVFDGRVFLSNGLERNAPCDAADRRR